MMSWSKLIFRIVVFAGLYYPALFIILFYSFVLQAMNKLGRMPEYDHPDPKELGFEFHSTLIYGVGEFWLIPVFALVAGFFSKKYLGIRNVHLVIAVVLLCFVMLTFFSPLMEWFVD